MISRPDPPSHTSSASSSGVGPLLLPTRWTWQPILLGTFCGVVVSGLFRDAACQIIAATCPGPFAGRMPARFGIYFTIYVYSVIAAGGLLGSYFSEWDRKRAYSLTFAMLLMFAAFMWFGERLQAVGYWR